MAKKHYTSLGDQIDMTALASRHAQTVALGNAKMNARGDILGEGGMVLRTQEQIEAEWRKTREEMAETAGLPSNIKEPLPGSMPRTKKLTDDQDFDPTVADSATDMSVASTEQASTTNGEMIKNLVEKQATSASPRRRRMVDSDQ